MKYLSLEGLTEYTTKLLNKITEMLGSKADIDHTHKYLPLSGGTLTDNVLSTTSDSSERHFQVNNSLHNGHLCVSTNGNLGIYSNTHSKWLVKCDTNGNVTLNGTIDNSDKLDGCHATDFCKTSLSPDTDMNKVTASGAYRVNQGNTNAPSGTDWGQIFVVHGGGDTIAQLMFDYQKGKCWLRTGNPSDVNGAGTWTEWRSLYTSENITYGTTDLTAGSSSLATGSIYLKYE